MAVRAVRGAISVRANEPSEIITATKRMLTEAIEANRVALSDIVSIVFVVTRDLDAAFPAKAAREIGLLAVPLLDMVSPDVKGSMPKVIRMLLTWNTDLAQDDVTHVYLDGARALRPDLHCVGQKKEGVLE